MDRQQMSVCPAFVEADSSLGVTNQFVLRFLQEETEYAVRDGTGNIGKEIVIAQSGGRIAAPDDFAETPAVRLKTARFLRECARSPVSGRDHVRLIRGGVIAVEVQSEKRRHGPFDSFRQIQKQNDRMSVSVGRCKIESDFLPDGCIFNVSPCPSDTEYLFSRGFRAAIFLLERVIYGIQGYSSI